METPVSSISSFKLFRHWVFLLIAGLTLAIGPWFSQLYFCPCDDSRGAFRLLPVEANHFIFGTSRAAQGVDPNQFRKTMSGANSYNFSFNLSDSPWSAEYCELIKSKLEESVNRKLNSEFIFFVDHWSLASEGSNSVFHRNIPSSSRNQLKYYWYGTNPLQVLAGSEVGDLGGMIIGVTQRACGIQPTFFECHCTERSRGWLPNIGRNPSFTGKINEYQRNASRYDSTSYERNLQSLRELILDIRSNFPKAKIHLVRPPVCNGIQAVEDSLHPSLEHLIRPLIQYSDTYIDFSKALEDTSFVDGNHINASSVQYFTQLLEDQITEHALQQP